MLAINGEFERPNAKTSRMARELKNTTNVVLPGKPHLTTIAAPYMPKEYLESLVHFVNKNDRSKTAAARSGCIASRDARVPL